MGVNKVLPRLQAYHRNNPIEVVSSLRRVAVDTSAWLHCACAMYAREYVLDHRYDNICGEIMRRIGMLKDVGLDVVMVFDNLQRMPGKLVDGSRDSRRAAANAKIEELVRDRKESEIPQPMLAAAITRSAALVTEVLNTLVQHGVKYLVAPREADAQLAYMSNNMHVGAVISPDSDLIVHGVDILIEKVNFGSPALWCDYYDLRELWSAAPRSPKLELFSYLTLPVSSPRFACPWVEVKSAARVERDAGGADGDPRSYRNDPLTELCAYHGRAALLMFAAVSGCDYNKFSGCAEATAMQTLLAVHNSRMALSIDAVAEHLVTVSGSNLTEIQIKKGVLNAVACFELAPVYACSSSTYAPKAFAPSAVLQAGPADNRLRIPAYVHDYRDLTGDDRYDESSDVYRRLVLARLHPTTREPWIVAPFEFDLESGFSTAAALSEEMIPNAQFPCIELSRCSADQLRAALQRRGIKIAHGAAVEDLRAVAKTYAVAVRCPVSTLTRDALKAWLRTRAGYSPTAIDEMNKEQLKKTVTAQLENEDNGATPRLIDPEGLGLMARLMSSGRANPVAYPQWDEDLQPPGFVSRTKTLDKPATWDGIAAEGELKQARQSGWLTDLATISRDAPYVSENKLLEHFRSRISSEATDGGYSTRVVFLGSKRASAATSAGSLWYHPPVKSGRHGELAWFRLATFASMKSIWYETVLACKVSEPQPDSFVEMMKVVKGRCACPAGLSGLCTHIAQLLWTIHLLPRPDDSKIPPTSTSIRCAWNAPSPGDAMDVVIPLRKAVIKQHRIFDKADKRKSRQSVHSDAGGRSLVLPLESPDAFVSKLDVADLRLQSFDDRILSVPARDKCHNFGTAIAKSLSRFKNLKGGACANATYCKTILQLYHTPGVEREADSELGIPDEPELALPDDECEDDEKEALGPIGEEGEDDDYDFGADLQDANESDSFERALLEHSMLYDGADDAGGGKRRRVNGDADDDDMVDPGDHDMVDPFADDLEPRRLVEDYDTPMGPKFNT